jgi:hypothetical protein
MGQVKSGATVSERHRELFDFQSTFSAPKQCAERSPLEHRQSHAYPFDNVAPPFKVAEIVVAN